MNGQTTWSEDMFPWLGPITDSWQTIREFARIKRDEFVPYRQEQLYHGDWLVYGIINQSTGFQRYDRFLSPLLSRMPCKPYMASISLLSPNTEIYPHYGITDQVIRFHLGLCCPTNAGIRIAGVEHRWEEGRWLIFNDREEHSAWNRSELDRIILLMDFYRSDIGLD